MDIVLYNSLGQKKEKFTSLAKGVVKMYTCGPTVYYYPHIGNWRTFVFEDVLRRALEFNGYKVIQVMNATDVGHLTGDNIGDADIGEDRMEKAAKREGRSAWDIAEFYIKDFIESRNKLNILAPEYFVRATNTIKDQIELVKKLEEKGLIYKTKMGIYFDVSKYPKYGKLRGKRLKDQRKLTREELVEDKEKKNQYDFALWKFSLPGENRQMEWESPWGTGYPGWHVECSAMSMKYLGDSFDIHTGGVDHIAIHHTNEIAQSEGATGKPMARFWLHGEFLKVDGGRMGKSLGNAYTLHDIEKKGFEPLALRYLYLTAHYRDTLNFTWKSLDSAAQALKNLRQQVLVTKKATRTVLSQEKRKKADDFSKRFEKAVNDDLNTPKALSIVWQAMKSNIPSEDKYDLCMMFDEVLGLGLRGLHETVIPDSIVKMVKERERLRKESKFKESDRIRAEIEKEGYVVKDTDKGPVVGVK